MSECSFHHYRTPGKPTVAKAAVGHELNAIRFADEVKRALAGTL